MIHLPLILTLLSSGIFIYYVIIYNKKRLSGDVTPNIVSWLLFSAITLMNSLTYIFITNDIFKSSLAFTDFFSCIVISYLIFSHRKVSSLKRNEKIIILLVLLSIVSWIFFRSASFANLILQPAYILAFVPTLISTYHNPDSENSFIWFMWTSSFVLIIIVILLRWQGSYIDLLNPALALILHASVGILALGKNNNKIN